MMPVASHAAGFRPHRVSAVRLRVCSPVHRRVRALYDACIPVRVHTGGAQEGAGAGLPNHRASSTALSKTPAPPHRNSVRARGPTGSTRHTHERPHMAERTNAQTHARTHGRAGGMHTCTSTRARTHVHTGTQKQAARTHARTHARTQAARAHARTHVERERLARVELAEGPHQQRQQRTRHGHAEAAEPDAEVLRTKPTVTVAAQARVIAAHSARAHGQTDAHSARTCTRTGKDPPTHLPTQKQINTQTLTYPHRNR
jgi:hypothetical protein